MLNLKKTTSLTGLLVVFAATGCATTAPSKELVNARTSYQHLQSDDSAALVPQKVSEAEEALKQAESAHQDDAGSKTEQQLGYVALRKIQLAKVYGDDAAAKVAKEMNEKALLAKHEKLRLGAEQEVQRESAMRRGAEVEVALTKEELEQANAKLQQLEHRLAAALASLKELADVKADARGLTITLSGSVLFKTGEADLLPTAKVRLTEVAKALQDLDPNQKITVFGHTDSVGTKESNDDLSQRRAESVRTYLISQGVSKEIISAKGMGEGTPVAENKTPEGRANNRRVELRIE